MHAGAGSDAAFAGGLDQVGLAALQRRHALDDAFLALDVFFGLAHVHLTGLGRHLRGQLVHQARQPAHVLHLLQLAQKVFQVKAAAAFHLGGELLRGRHVHAGSDLLNQRQDVAHAQNAAGVTLGVKHLQAVELFAGARELDRRTGDLPHRQCGTAARVTIGLGQDDAGQRQRILECLGRVHRVLALHGVHHEQGFDRVEDGVQLLDLGHQGFVNRQAAGGVHQQHIKKVPFGVVQRSAGDVDRFLLRAAGEPFGTCLGRHGFELLDGGRAVDVAGDRQHFFLALVYQVLGQLGGGGGLARALQAGHQDHGGRLRRQVDIAHALAHGGGQLTVDDTDQRLARRERAHDFLTQGFFLDACNEVAHHRQRHIGLEQGHAHFAQHVLHIRLGDAGLATHFLDQAGEFVCEG